MKTSPHYRLPFLLAIIVAIASMPTSVYRICAWNCGTLKTEPWHRKVTAGFARLTESLASRVRGWFGASGGLTGLPALTCLMLVLALGLHYVHPTHGSHDVMLMGLTGLKAFRQKDADLKAELKQLTKDKVAIGEKAMAENRPLNEKDKADRAAFATKIEAVEAQLAENAELLADAEAQNEADRNFAALGHRNDPDAAAAAAAAAAGGVRVEMGDGPVDKMAKSKFFMGFALHAVRRIALKEEGEHDRALVRRMADSKAAGPTGASTDVPSDGGFLVAPEQSSTIIQRSYDTGEISRLVTRQPISGNAINLPAVDETSRANGSRFGGISSTWIGQGTTVTAGKPKFRLMELKLKKLLAFVYGTDELVADAVAFGAFVNRNLPLELNFATEDAIVNGDGSNKPQGILNSGAAVTVTRNTASRVLYEDVSGMWKRMWAPLRKGAIWMIDQSVEQDLEQLSIAIGSAGVLAPIYRPAGISVGPDGTQGYSPATLYGRPILTTEYNANLGTVGDIVLWNPGEYTLIDRGNVEQAVSLHVAFLTDEMVWRFTYRADGQLNWSAPLTPKSGGSTLSPVVTLT